MNARAGRRRVLLVAAVLVGGLVLSGCGAPLSGDEREPIPVDGSGQSFAIGDPVEDVSPHTVTVVNDGNEIRTVAVSVAVPVRNETLLNRSYSLAPGERVRGELRRPAYYELAVDLPRREATHSDAIETFDHCNSYGTTVQIRSDGSLSARTGSTLAGCENAQFPTPTPTAAG
ncbi:hypothetical protein I7X12_02150 [Halosimplex litoreum]|uniref:Uncharacterized protein n=1 Tax=Halosimplex litoreum TaxID=1198301 RepID=A0A7T3FZA8_9EURY|nr:hypothetical protein [Halosimplex litoreum]QPV63460.1 hypothetical protein I7X12_02150 [Halosimplex litoreum]